MPRFLFFCRLFCLCVFVCSLVRIERGIKRFFRIRIVFSEHAVRSGFYGLRENIFPIGNRKRADFIDFAVDKIGIFFYRIGSFLCRKAHGFAVFLQILNRRVAQSRKLLAVLYRSIQFFQGRFQFGKIFNRLIIARGDFFRTFSKIVYGSFQFRRALFPHRHNLSDGFLRFLRCGGRLQLLKRVVQKVLRIQTFKHRRNDFFALFERVFLALFYKQSRFTVVFIARLFFFRFLYRSRKFTRRFALGSERHAGNFKVLAHKTLF